MIYSTLCVVDLCVRDSPTFTPCRVNGWRNEDAAEAWSSWRTDIQLPTRKRRQNVSSTSHFPTLWQCFFSTDWHLGLTPKVCVVKWSLLCIGFNSQGYEHVICNYLHWWSLAREKHIQDLSLFDQSPLTAYSLFPVGCHCFPKCHFVGKLWALLINISYFFIRYD